MPLNYVNHLFDCRLSSLSNSRRQRCRYDTDAFQNDKSTGRASGKIDESDAGRLLQYDDTAFTCFHVSTSFKVKNFFLSFFFIDVKEFINCEVGCFSVTK